MAELIQIERVIFLQSADLFTHCKAEEVLRIAAIAHERRFNTGDTIFTAARPATALCLPLGELHHEQVDRALPLVVTNVRRLEGMDRRDIRMLEGGE